MEAFNIEEVLAKLDRQLDGQNQSDPWVVYVSDKGPLSCTKCMENHGKRFRKSDLSKPALPIHPNCKCKYEILDNENAKKVVVRSATVRVVVSRGMGGVRISNIDDMLMKLEKKYAPGTLSELVISGHGDLPGEFEIGGKADRLDIMTPKQIGRLKKILSFDAIIDIRMCYGIGDTNGENVAQNMANKLRCKIRAYANQVSPFGTRPAIPKNIHFPFWKRPFVGTGSKIFYPQK